jgi:hypothetical protein
VPTYLVERYWPGVTSELLLKALDRGRQVMEEMSREGTPVRDLTCTDMADGPLYTGKTTSPPREVRAQLNSPTRVHSLFISFTRPRSRVLLWPEQQD